MNRAPSSAPTFSLRSFLIAIAVLAVWLGAIVSRSIIFLEVISHITTLFIVLTLPLAIWDPRPQTRPYWTGFFALAAANYLLIAPWGAISPMVELLVFYLTESMQLFPDTIEATPPSPVVTPNPARLAWFLAGEQTLRKAAAACTSLGVGTIGGPITAWFATRRMAANQQC